MRSHALYVPALVIAAMGAALVPLSVLFEPARAGFVQPMTVGAAVVAIALFLRMLFDPQCRRGINAANKELQRDRPLRFRWIPFFDPQWGLFGARVGERPLQIVRAVLFAEFIVALVLAGSGPNDLLLLAAASLLVAMMLSIIHLGLNTRAQVL